MAVLVLLGVLYVVISAVFGGTQAPRTIVESKLAQYEAQIKADPGSVEPRLEYAKVLIYAGDYAAAKRAIEDGRAALAEGRSPAEFMLLEVHMLVAQEQYGEALALSESLLEEYPKFEVEAKQDLVDKGVTQGAFERLKPGQEILLEIHILRARILAATGEWESVVEETTKALAVDPNAADVLTLRGNAYFELGNTDLARADYERALQFEFEPAAAALEELDK